MPPNVLLISSHDSGRHFGCYGVPSVQTPAIDRLAREGVRCTNHFAVSPICSPSRASLTTGLYPQHHGVMGISTHPWNWPLERPECHLSRHFREAGFTTALFGLQHETGDVSQLGFEIRPSSPETRAAPEVAEAVVDFLQARRPNDPPFYAQVGFFESHTPYDFGGATPDEERGVEYPPHLLADAPARLHLAALQGALRQLDHGVGLILAALERGSLTENTIVIFTSDHGIEVPRAKWYLYDPGIATALIARWPRGLDGGYLCDTLLSNVDLAPTLLDLAGLPHCEEKDGLSAADCLRGKTPEIHSEIFGFQHGYEARSIRTRNHKLIWNFELRPELRCPAEMTRPKLGRPQAPVAELYDLIRDPLEFHNLAGESRYSAILAVLHRQLKQWLEATHDPILQGPLPTPFYKKARLNLFG